MSNLRDSNGRFAKGHAPIDGGSGRFQKGRGLGEKRGPLPEATKQKLSAILKGRPPWSAGRKCPQISAAKIGKKRPDMVGNTFRSGKKQSTEEIAKRMAKLRPILQSPEYRAAQSARMKGRVGPMLGRKYSEESRKLLSDVIKRRYQNPEYRAKMEVLWKRLSGPAHPLWKGNRTTLRAIRGSCEYSAWRRAVIERDKGTCLLCGAKQKRMIADHIQPFAYCGDGRLDTANGRTLCVECHKKTDTYGFKAVKNHGSKINVS